MNASELGNQKTESEILFEEYLTTHGHTDWTHEPPAEGKRKNPDYRLRFDNELLIFEVKEFDGPMPPPGFSAYNPYVAIREKINQAAKQFREYKAFSCSVVLANPKSAFVHLGDRWAIFGAMLGNLGYQFQLGVRADEKHTIENVFTSGGKMMNDKRMEPQNTTVSSVIVLGRYPLRLNRIRIAILNRQLELGRGTTLEENLTFYEAIPDTIDLRPVSVVVYENPFARIPLRRDLFCGLFDERWGAEVDFMRRVFVGSEVAGIESILGERE